MIDDNSSRGDCDESDDLPELVKQIDKPERPETESEESDSESDYGERVPRLSHITFLSHPRLNVPTSDGPELQRR